MKMQSHLLTFALVISSALADASEFGFAEFSNVIASGSQVCAGVIKAIEASEGKFAVIYDGNHKYDLSLNTVMSEARAVVAMYELAVTTHYSGEPSATRALPASVHPSRDLSHCVFSAAQKYSGMTGQKISLVENQLQLDYSPEFSTRFLAVPSVLKAY
jgi:hypothetical protein